MKNTFSKELLKKAFDKYLNLKNNEKFLQDYHSIQQLDKQLSECSGQNKEVKGKFFADYFINLFEAQTKWDLQYLINPKYKIRENNIYRAIKPGSSIAKFIYAFKISQDQTLLKPKRRVIQISKQKTVMDIRIKKLLCSMLITKTKISQRAVGRIFGVDKETVRKWADEVEEWIPTEKENVFAELMSSKNQFCKTDVFDLNDKLRTSLPDNC